MLPFNTKKCPLWLFIPRRVFSGRHFGVLCQQTRFIVPVESPDRSDTVWFIDTGSHESSKILGKSDKCRLNSSGLRTHPCFSPTQGTIGGDSKLSIFTRYCTSEYMFWVNDNCPLCRI